MLFIASVNGTFWTLKGVSFLSKISYGKRSRLGFVINAFFLILRKLNSTAPWATILKA